MEELEFEHELFREFAELFNRGEYYASHEAMEKLWIKHGRRKGDAYQGYVQLAASLEQHKRGQLRGAARLFAKAREKLKHLEGDSRQTADLLRDMERFLDAADANLPRPKIK